MQSCVAQNLHCDIVQCICFDPIHQVLDPDSFINSCIAILNKPREYHMLLCVDHHILFEVPPMGFFAVGHAGQFLFSLCHQVVNVDWSQEVADQCKVNTTSIPGIWKWFDIGPATVDIAVFS